MGCVKRKGMPFYNLRPISTLPLQFGPLNGGSQPKDCNLITSPQIFVLGFVLIFFHVPSCFVQDVIVQIQDVIVPVNGRCLTF
jgi:hypothetical protein